MLPTGWFIYIGLSLTVGIGLGCLIGRLWLKTQTLNRDHALNIELSRLQQQVVSQQEQWQALQQVELARNRQAQAQLESMQERLKQQDEILNRGAAQSSVYQTRAEELEKRYLESKQQHSSLLEKYDETLARLNDTVASHAQIKASLHEREHHHRQQLQQFEEQKTALAEQFKLLANDILESKVKSLQDTTNISVSALINPFQQSINEFKKEIKDIHHRETTAQGELRKELEVLKELNYKITAEAHELSTALRGQKKLQGNWGELVLENVLDRSGLVLGQDYKREVSFNTEEGRARPDVIVYLPQDKHLVIDAKVSLNAYTRFVNADDEVERATALKSHVKAVSERIQELADKDYYKLPGLNSPDIVFMFIPIESAFVEALKADDSLFQKAIENNVLVATPTTLLTSLNIVRQLWRYEDQNKHTAVLAQKAEQVFKKLNTFLKSFEDVKKGLNKAQEAYCIAEAQLLSGKGNLVKQVGDFKNLAPAIKQELPAYFTEKAALEIDLIRHEPASQA